MLLPNYGEPVVFSVHSGSSRIKNISSQSFATSLSNYGQPTYNVPTHHSIMRGAKQRQHGSMMHRRLRE